MSAAEFLTRLLQLHKKFARDEKFTYESLCLCVYMCVGGRGFWLVVLRLNVPVNNFSVISGRSHRFLGN